MNDELQSKTEKYNNIYLPRVRHLKSLCIRNLSYKFHDVNQLQIFFTLHKNPNSHAFHKSDTLYGTLNPWWQSFDLTYLPYHHTSSCVVTLRIWVIDRQQTPKVHIECAINLLYLVPSSDQFDVNDYSNKSAVTDAIYLSMFDCVYTLPGSDIVTELTPTLMVPNGAPLKDAYSCNALRRLQVVLRALKQTEQSVEMVREDIQKRLLEIKSLTMQKQEIESITVRLSELEDRYERSRLLRSQRKLVADKKRSETNKLEKEMTANEILMRDDDSHHGQLRSDNYDLREKLLKGNTLLCKRHKQMIHELCVIYPIEDIGDGKYMIAGVQLPHGDHLLTQDERATATALGYTAHLVQMMSQFLSIPLQFPIEHRSSRSLIYDYIRPNDYLNAQKPLAFPLYSKGKDKFHFRTAVFLLSKNIANLRYAYGLTTKDIWLILRNLRELLHNKFDVGISNLKPTEHLSAPPLIYRTQSTPSLPTSHLAKELKRRSTSGVTSNLLSHGDFPSAETPAAHDALNGIKEDDDESSDEDDVSKRNSTKTLIASNSDDAEVTASNEAKADINEVTTPNGLEINDNSDRKLSQSFNAANSSNESQTDERYT